MQRRTRHFLFLLPLLLLLIAAGCGQKKSENEWRNYSLQEISFQAPASWISAKKTLDTIYFSVYGAPETEYVATLTVHDREGDWESIRPEHSREDVLAYLCSVYPSANLMNVNSTTDPAEQDGFLFSRMEGTVEVSEGENRYALFVFFVSEKKVVMVGFNYPETPDEAEQKKIDTLLLSLKELNP